jgi:hypothetical protein
VRGPSAACTYRAAARLWRRDGWGRAELLGYQQRALDRLRKHAYNRSSFSATFTPANLINRTELPVLTKATLMENFDQLDTRSNLRLIDVVDYLSRLAGTSCSSSAYYVSATGGTTGRRGVFLRTFAEWMQVVGSYDRAFNWAGSTGRVDALGQDRRVVSTTNPTHQSGRVGASTHSRCVPALRIDSGEPLDHRDPAQHLAAADVDRVRLDSAADGRGAASRPFDHRAPVLIQRVGGADRLHPATRHDRLEPGAVHLPQHRPRAKADSRHAASQRSLLSESRPCLLPAELHPCRYRP